MPPSTSTTVVTTQAILRPIFRTAQEKIDEKHAQLGGDVGLLGSPIEDMNECPNSIGFFRKYSNGMIYWNPDTDAHEIHGSILGTWSSLGFERSFLGYPLTDESSTPDGVGRFNHFQGGSIYWTPDTGAHEVHGAIRDKWQSMGWERSFLGYPFTDESPTPDGVGRFNHFQGGSIYWTPDTGAHEVHGAIKERWAALGFERSFLGFPVTDETDFTEGGRISVFQGGEIYFWPDTGAIELNDVVVHYTGLICFGETDSDQLSNSDEPYVVMGIITPTGTSTSRTEIMEDVDGGESRPGLIELYRGKPRGMTINVLLMEHDDDDPDKYKAAMTSAVGAVAGGIAALTVLIPIVGPFLAAPIGTLLGTITPDVGKFLNELLDTQDDVIGQTTIALTPKMMVILAARTPNSTDRGVGFKASTDLISGLGASYKVYFGLVPA